MAVTIFSTYIRALTFENFCQGRFALTNAFSGYNVCLFAYGQTGAGKSFSMVGGPEDRGIVPRVAHELFEYIESKKQDNIAFEVVTSMIEIYKEKISDLLADAKKSKTEELKVREHPKTGPYVAGLTALSAHTYSEIERFLEMGNRNKSVAATHMNDVSSRAHTIFSIKFCQTHLEHLGNESGLARETKKVSHINLVDLAGRYSLLRLLLLSLLLFHFFIVRIIFNNYANSFSIRNDNDYNKNYNQ